MRSLANLFISAALLTTLSACEPDNCVVGSTRCELNRAQICGSDRNWYNNLNCNELGGETVDWTCCWMPEDLDAGIPAGHGCVQGTSCPGVDGS